jgi:hypothetical protein
MAKEVSAMSRTVMSPSFISQMPSVSPSIISAPMSAAASSWKSAFSAAL